MPETSLRSATHLKVEAEMAAVEEEPVAEAEQDMTPSYLMNKAANKYKLLKTKEMWEAPSAESEITALKSTVGNIQKVLKRSSATAGNENTPNKSKKIKKVSKKKPQPAWMKFKPDPANLTKPREWNGKSWWWCSPETGGKCDGKYRAHKPSECWGTAKKKATSDNDLNKSVKIKAAIEEMEGGYES